MQKHVDCYELEADELKSKLDSQSITEKQYIDEMLVLWEKYYANQVDLAEVAKEKKLELLDEEKSYLQSVASAATALLDNQIDDLEDQKDSAVKVYEDQIEVVENLKKPLEEQLEMMEKAREKEEKILALQKAQAALKRAENQRSQFKYVDGQMVYTADDKAIKDAQDNVDEAEFELAKFKIQEQIDAYDRQIDKLNELIDKTISEIQIMLSVENIDRLNENEQKIGYALLEMLMNWEEIFKRLENKKFNKTSVLFFLKEYTMLSSKDIREGMRKYKNLYFFTKEKLINE